MNKVLLINLIISTTAFSQESLPKVVANPIDVSQKGCLDSTQNQTTLGMISCNVRAEQAWDKELNRYYKLLMGILSTDEKTKLKASQIKWLEFRDAEVVTANTIYTDMQGTMWKIVAVGTKMEMVKQRALELKSYYDNLNMGK